MLVKGIPGIKSEVEQYFAYFTLSYGCHLQNMITSKENKNEKWVQFW